MLLVKKMKIFKRFDINPSNINPDPDAKQEPIVFSVTGTETWKTPTTGTNVTF